MNANDSDKDKERPAYLVFDTESVPDGVLLARTWYVGADLTPEQAVARAQVEARESSPRGNDILPVTFQIPVAVAVAKVAADFRLLSLSCLDAPHFRPVELVKGFWRGVEHYRARLVSFNGRGWDIPLLELAAFRYGVAAPFHFADRSEYRRRFGHAHIDLLDLMTNDGKTRFHGGLHLLSKLLGKPGKIATRGSDVYGMFLGGQLQEINDYCCFDVLDTYFVFLRTRVLTGELPLEREQTLVRESKAWLEAQACEQPYLHRYLEHWGDWQPWP